MTASAQVRRGALKAYREGRACVKSVRYQPGNPRAEIVNGQVHGYNGLHQVSLWDGTWSCSCQTPGCAHILAIQLVTGHAAAPLESPAAPAVLEDQAAPLEPAPATTELLSRVGWTRAAFNGTCARCGTPYFRHDPIRAVKRADQQPGTVWAGACCEALL